MVESWDWRAFTAATMELWPRCVFLQQCKARGDVVPISNVGSLIAGCGFGLSVIILEHGSGLNNCIKIGKESAFYSHAVRA